MINYKRECKFDFAKCMKFFLVNINGCIDRNDVELSPKNKVTYTITCYSYPYDYHVINLIEKTFLVRNIGVKMKSYRFDKDEKGKKTYVYIFQVGLLDKDGKL